jgi:glycyl-tRNA synthetase
MVNFAKMLSVELKYMGYAVELDSSGWIGKRYRRQDEIGTPYCICVDHSTIDPESPDYQTVTIRNRDTMEQERVHVKEVAKYRN